MNHFKSGKPYLMFVITVIAFFGCNNNSLEKKPPAINSNSLFTLLPSEKTHIDFTNTLTEGLNTNVLIYEYFYNSGGVAIGDLNGEGLQDIYFTGNMTNNKL